MNPRIFLALLATASLWCAAAAAENAGDPSEEQRAHALFREVRCVVCQGQSIADSNADLADAMRALVREKIAGGWSDAQIKDFLRERYGDYILLAPPLTPRTYALWFGPLILLLAGILLIRKLPARRNSGDAS